MKKIIRTFGYPLLLLAIGTTSMAQSVSSEPSDPVVNGIIKVTDQIRLPAREPGVLVHLDVKEGSQVRAGQVIGKIDDSQPLMQRKAAQAAYAGAYKRFTDDVDIRFSELSAAVAKVAYEMTLEANKIAEKAVTEIEVRQKELEWKKMELSIEKATKEKELAKYEAFTKQAEVEAADLAIERRVIVAPFDGVVEDLMRKQDEWVNPGDPILRLFRLDTVHVEGAVDQSKYDPHELQGCDVTVVVQMARGRTENVRGRVTKVSSIVRGDGRYNVRAEVPNRQEFGTWILRDGLPATMTIHLGTGSAAATEVTRTP